MKNGLKLEFIPCLLRIMASFNYIRHIKINVMSKGTVKFFNDSKGFGFIIEDETNEDRFVHVTGLIDEIKEGDAVEYELEEGKRGLNATNVKVV
ncbi:MAG: CspA family cold shock protein [Flavobacteriaceae bacterium]|jgi:CspA family cold shock protein